MMVLIKTPPYGCYGAGSHQFGQNQYLEIHHRGKSSLETSPAWSDTSKQSTLARAIDEIGFTHSANRLIKLYAD
jgi:hypothetical protein